MSAPVNTRRRVVALGLVLLSSVAALPSPSVASAEGTVAFFGGPPDSLQLVPGKSTLRWSGAALGGAARAAGTVRVTNGLVVTRHQMIEAGSFTVDMRSLAGDGAASNAAARTLSSASWFDVARFPTAQFVPTEARLVTGSTYMIQGNVTLHGVTKPVSFQADVAWPEAGHALVYGTMAVDRRDFDVGPALPGATEMRLAMKLDFQRKPIRTLSTR